MTAAARERLARVSLVKPDNARAVEEHLLRLAQARKLTAQVGEDDIIRILEEVTRAGATRVVVARKKRAGDDDDDDNDDDL